jgi:hypothetical protein
VPSAEDRAARSNILPVLEEVALWCWREQKPLIPLISCYWEDGSVDLPTARWLWRLRYGDSEKKLPENDEEALVAVTEEVARAQQWCAENAGQLTYYRPEGGRTS